MSIENIEKVENVLLTKAYGDNKEHLMVIRKFTCLNLFDDKKIELSDVDIHLTCLKKFIDECENKRVYRNYNTVKEIISNIKRYRKIIKEKSNE